MLLCVLHFVIYGLLWEAVEVAHASVPRGQQTSFGAIAERRGAHERSICEQRCGPIAANVGRRAPSSAPRSQAPSPT